jgi:phosphomannomutase
VALAAVHPAFDAFQAMACILERSARRGARVSRLVEELPRYHIVKEKIACPPSKINAVMGEIKRRYRRHEMDLSDGIRIEDKTGWLQVRFSGTEPMVRIIAEDESRDKARERAGEAIRAIEALLR